MVSAYRGFVDLKYKPSESDLICQFRAIPAPGISTRSAAEHIAGESSVGTWTVVGTMSPRIKKMGAKVFEIKSAKPKPGAWLKIAYPVELFEEGNMAQILSSIAGNIFGMRAITDLRLEDVRWPAQLVRSFKGPVFGIAGIRKLVRVPRRPLCGTIIKPKLGLREREHAKAAYQAWTGGIDIVKDDENLTSQSFNQFKRRVTETLKLRDRAERATGERKIYMPNVSAETREMLRRAAFVKARGGEYAMVDILTVGWSALQTLREENDRLKMVLHAHRAMHAALTRNPAHGISMGVVAEIARLIGVDQLHIGTGVGKMEATAEEVSAIEGEIENKIVTPHGHILGQSWHHIKPVFAVCSGGLHPGLVPPLVKMLGRDIIIQAGGGVHGHPKGTAAGARAMRQAIDAALANIPLKEWAEEHKELAAALKKWRYISPK